VLRTMSAKRPPMLSAEERPPIPWLHEMYDDLMYRWVVKNRLMRNDEHGLELTYKGRTGGDVICGERTIRPGIPGAKGYSWRMDQSVDHEVVCTIVGEHREVPHVGVPADCADMTCRCAAYGCHHLVIVGFAMKPTADVSGQRGMR
jgi:hypothetical protein